MRSGGGGQTPFFLSFLGNLSAIVGAALISFGVGRAVGRVQQEDGISRLGHWTARLFYGLVYSLVIAAAELWIAFGLVGVVHEATMAQTFLFLVLALWATLTIVLFLIDLFGIVGVGLAAIFGVILGLVSSGALVPLQSLTGFSALLSDWLPVRYMLDGFRSLLFFGGREEAGLSEALRIFWMYLVGVAFLGYVVAFVRDVRDRNEGRSQSADDRSAVH